MPFDAFPDAAEAPAGPMELYLAAKAAARQRGSSRNMREYRRVGELAKMGPNAARELGRLVPGQAMESVASQAAPELAAQAIGHAGGTSEIGRGLDPEMMSAIQRQFAARAARESAAGGNSQGNMARARADEMRRQGLSRPTLQSKNAERMAARLAMMERMQQMQMAPQIALAQAQHGMDPLQQAHANHANAAADSIRSQIQPSAPVASHPVVPGGPVRIAPGVTWTPPSPYDMAVRKRQIMEELMKKRQPQDIPYMQPGF